VIYRTSGLFPPGEHTYSFSVFVAGAEFFSSRTWPEINLWLPCHDGLVHFISPVPYLLSPQPAGDALFSLQDPLPANPF